MVLRTIELLLEYLGEDHEEHGANFAASGGGGSSRSFIRRIGSRIQDAPLLCFVLSVLQGRPHGRRRSVVRWIASYLPIPRWLFPHLQVLEAGGLLGAPCGDERPSVPSFAEVIYFPIVEGVANRCCSRAELRLNRGAAAPHRTDTRGEPERAGNAGRTERTDDDDDDDGDGDDGGGEGGGGGGGGGGDPLVKIAALEAELARLRAQIAAIVTATPGAGEPDHTTPVATVVCAAAAPPPPPLPPPPPPRPTFDGVAGALQLIRQRRQRRLHRGDGADGGGGDAGPGGGSERTPVPDMMDVLRNLGKVKLRVIERSPGGRPVPCPLRAGATPPRDAATLIAQALRRKFALSRVAHSPESSGSPASPGNFSPDAPKFGRHLLRATGRSLEQPFDTISSSSSSSSSSSLGSPLYMHS